MDKTTFTYPPKQYKLYQQIHFIAKFGQILAIKNMVNDVSNELKAKK